MDGRLNPMFKKPGLVGTEPANRGLLREGMNREKISGLRFVHASMEDADALLRGINAACAPRSAGHKDIESIVL